MSQTCSSPVKYVQLPSGLKSWTSCLFKLLYQNSIQWASEVTRYDSFFFTGVEDIETLWECICYGLLKFSWSLNTLTSNWPERCHDWHVTDKSANVAVIGKMCSLTWIWTYDLHLIMLSLSQLSNEVCIFKEVTENHDCFLNNNCQLVYPYSHFYCFVMITSNSFFQPARFYRC